MAIIGTLVSGAVASASFVQFNSGIAMASSATPSWANTPGGSAFAVEGVVQDGVFRVNPHVANPGVFTAGTPVEGSITNPPNSSHS